MKSVKRIVQRLLALVCLLAPTCLMAQPTIDAPNQTDVQAETHFLTFIGSFVPESPASATAYYNAIDPGAQKRKFTQWLVNAGFIQNEGEWNSSGPQTVVPQSSSVHGYGIINADAHVIVLNAADLGFVRNQFIRCKPSCNAKNRIIYTYLENYPVGPFATTSGFPNVSGTPTLAEAQDAIHSALSRPLGVKGGDGVSPCNGSPQCIERIADVAFEWAPPANNPTSSTRFGQQYAFLFGHDSSGVTETISWSTGAANAQNSRITGHKPFPPLCSNAPGSAACAIVPDMSGQLPPFAPELDARGAKQMPGVCLVCHGGSPQNLTSTGAFPRGGNINGFRFLPLDNANLMFGTVADQTDKTSQQADIKEYNKDVLLTVPTSAETDDQGVRRVAHLREVIQGWYAPNMTGTSQNENFVPAGWGGNPNSTLGQFYLNVVAPNCRTCHFNRELSLDFGTVGAFDQESDLLQLALLVECNANTPGYSIDPNLRPMPLAHLTFERFWQNVSNVNNSSNPPQNPNMSDQIAANFGFGTVQGYCATNP